MRPVCADIYQFQRTLENSQNRENYQILEILERSIIKRAEREHPLDLKLLCFPNHIYTVEQRFIAYFLSDRLLGLGKVVIRSIHTPGPLRTFVSGDLTRVERDDSDESSMTPMSKHIAFHWRGAHSLP